MVSEGGPCVFTELISSDEPSERAKTQNRGGNACVGAEDPGETSWATTDILRVARKVLSWGHGLMGGLCGEGLQVSTLTACRFSPQVQRAHLEQDRHLAEVQRHGPICSHHVW